MKKKNLGSRIDLPTRRYLMIHNIDLVKRRLQGKPNANLLPLLVLALGLLAMGLLMFLNQ